MIEKDKVPAYIRDIAKRAFPTNEPYRLKVYGRRKVGGEVGLVREVERLVKWCVKHYADACIVERHLWHDDYATASQAYRHGHHNHYIVEITDPIMHRFERDGFYRQDIK